eukprot:UN30205
MASKRVLIQNLVAEQTSTTKKSSTSRRKSRPPFLVNSSTFSKKKKWSGESDVMKYLENLLVSGDTDEGKFKVNFHNCWEKCHKKKEVSEMLKDIRHQLDQLKNYIIQEHHSHLFSLLKKKNSKQHHYEINRKLELCAEACIERVLLNPIVADINEILTPSYQQGIQTVKYNNVFLRNNEQEDFSIRPKVQSSKKWCEAIVQIQQLRKEALPMEKLNSLVACAEAIHNEGSKGSDITGDDFMSIIIFVITRASNDDYPP